MKKNLLFFMLMVALLPLTIKADEIIVGKADLSKNIVPFLNSYQNSWMEMVYTAEEIGQACTIGSIAFQYSQGPALQTKDIRIYLAETTKSKFEDETQWTPEDELTLVYSGTNVVIGDEEWETFKLDKVFEYSGEKNLAVVVAKTANIMQSMLEWQCYISDKSIMFTGNVNNDHDESYAQYPTAEGLKIWMTKPVMKLIEPQLEAPTNLRALVEQDLADYPEYKYKITMMWDRVEGAQGYDVFVNTTAEKEFYFGYTGGNAYIAGSDQETVFEFYVVAFNQDLGLESDPSEVCVVTIVDDAIEEQTSSFNIYPNPVNDMLYIETETEIEEVSIFDVYGRNQNLRSSETQNLSISVDVANLNSGVYFVRIKTENGEVVKRFVKE